MPAIDLDKLLSDIVAAVNDILQKDVTLLRGYSQQKVKTIARFTKLVAEGYATGEISKEELEYELDELDGMIERFIRNLRALANVTIERLIKAVTSTVYGAIQAAARAYGVPLPAIDLAEN